MVINAFHNKSFIAAAPHRRCGNLDVARLQMVTPVHRFQTINSGGNSAGPSNPSSTRPPRSSSQNNDNRSNSAHPGSHLGQENISKYVLTPYILYSKYNNEN